MRAVNLRHVASIPSRNAVATPGTAQMAAHAAASIDAFSEGQLLTGEATSPSLEELQRRALVIHQQKKRLFVFFGTPDSECHAVGPATRCFCGHSYSSHAWYETDTKRVRCRVEGCRCECFKYVPGRGSTHIRCACKHGHAERCLQPACFLRTHGPTALAHAARALGVARPQGIAFFYADMRKHDTCDN